MFASIQYRILCVTVSCLRISRVKYIKTLVLYGSKRGLTHQGKSIRFRVFENFVPNNFEVTETGAYCM